MISPEIKQQLDEIKKFLICLHREVAYRDEYITDDYYTISDLVAKWEKEANADGELE